MQTRYSKMKFLVKSSEYDQEIPQSQTAAKPRHRAEEPRNTHETP